MLKQSSLHLNEASNSPPWLLFSSFSCGEHEKQFGWWKGFLRNLWVRPRCEQSWWSGSSCCLATPLATWSACCPWLQIYTEMWALQTGWKWIHSHLSVWRQKEKLFKQKNSHFVNNTSWLVSPDLYAKCDAKKKTSVCEESLWSLILKDGLTLAKRFTLTDGEGN